MRTREGFRARAKASWPGLALAVLLAWLPGAAVPPSSATSNPPAPAARRPIVLVALDAADWLTIDPLVRAGKLPSFARLRSAGRTGVMRATPPLISPIVWTTIATGVQPEDHGILDFMVDLPDGRQAPVASSDRLAAALWNVFSDAGRPVAVVGWWATWPPEHVRGTIVSDRFAPQLTRDVLDLDAAIWPASAKRAALDARARPESVTRDELSAYVPVTRPEFDALARTWSSPARFYEDKLAQLASVVASSRTYSTIAVRLARSDHPEFLAVYLEEIDTLSHLFVRDKERGTRSIERAYRDADELLGRLAESSDPDTLVVVCSDHGFHPATAAIAEDPSNLTGPATAWHRPYGIVGAADARTLAAHTGDRARAPRDIGVVTPIDVAPTLLHAAGLPVPADMPGRVLSEMLPADAAGRAVRRAPPSRYTRPVAARTSDEATADTWARLQALGYVGAARTSLARQNLGESLYRRGKLEAAERQLRSVVESRPDNVTAQLWLAKTLRDEGRSNEAMGVYEAIVGLAPGAPEALVEGVEVAVETGQTRRAEALVQKARTWKEAGAWLPLAHGVVAEAQKRPAEAERQYRAALKQDPLSFDASSRLFDLLRSTGRAREVVALVRQAVALAPDSPRHQALLGSALLATGDAIGAETALGRALALAPDGDAVRIDLARAQFLQGKTESALATATAAQPSPDRHVLLGAVYSSLGRWNEAVRELQRALDAGTVTPEVLNGLGWAQLKLGRGQDAATFFARSLALRGDQPEIRRLLAETRSGATPR